MTNTATTTETTEGRTMADTVLLVWGHGTSTVDAVRHAESDSNFVDTDTARALGGDYAVRDEETGGWLLLRDAWCVALDPRAIDIIELDRDPATSGYREIETGC